MISPHTPPGTRVVCIDADATHQKYASPGFNVRTGPGSLDGLREGEVYTVAEIRPSEVSRIGLCVVLTEIKRPGAPSRGGGYALERFRLAALPKCLTDILTADPIELRKHMADEGVR